MVAENLLFGSTALSWNMKTHFQDYEIVGSYALVTTFVATKPSVCYQDDMTDIMLCCWPLGYTKPHIGPFRWTTTYPWNAMAAKF